MKAREETSFSQRFEEIMPEILEEVKNKLKDFSSSQHYTVIWKEFEEPAKETIKEIILRNFPKAEVVITKAKSTYPDLKIIYDNLSYAIDIKTNESGKQPWYDIARLDTYIEKRHDIYQEEYEMLVKYERSSGAVVDIYFEPLYKVVGKHSQQNFIKYRPYDGKIRPKSWEMFESGEAYWNTKKEFLDGLQRAIIFRWKSYMKEWWEKMSIEDRKEMLEYFENNLELMTLEDYF